VRSGKDSAPEGTVGRSGGRCIATGTPIPLAHIKAAGIANELGADLIAVVAEGRRSRIYVSPDDAQSSAALVDRPTGVPRMRLSSHPQYMGTPRYGLDDIEDLFSNRQLLALMTFSELLRDVRDEVWRDALAVGMANDEVRLADGGMGAAAYADAIVTYLAFALDRLADRSSTLCSWDKGYVKVRNTFARQALAMTWDYAESNPFSDSTGNWSSCVEWIVKGVENAASPDAGDIAQRDAAARIAEAGTAVVCTDPPYYDNVPYADISDFFYAWLRHNLADVWPNELSTLSTPKQQELVADYQRHGSKETAKRFFESGVQRVFEAAAAALPNGYPLTVFYAFKAAETDDTGGQASTGWETFLQGVIDSGLSIEATWPMRTELSNRPRAIGAGALATSVVLACRPRRSDAPVATRKEFLAALRSELPSALRALQTGNVAPIDLPQAAIGPGTRIFTRYAKVIEADGSPLRVRQALAMINDVLGEVLFNQEGDFDPSSRWAISWFEQFGMNPGAFGQADNLARAKATAVDAIVQSGVAVRSGDKVRLVDRGELPTDWDPVTDLRLTVWEVAQHLLRRLSVDGEAGAAELLGRVGGLGELARELAYLLYGICERKGWTQEGLAYNGLVVSWPEISRLAAAVPTASGPSQQELL
jgi:putative DNA methylase